MMKKTKKLPSTLMLGFSLGVVLVFISTVHQNGELKSKHFVLSMDQTQLTSLIAKNIPGLEPI